MLLEIVRNRSNMCYVVCNSYTTLLALFTVLLTHGHRNLHIATNLTYWVVAGVRTVFLMPLTLSMTIFNKKFPWADSGNMYSQIFGILKSRPWRFFVENGHTLPLPLISPYVLLCINIDDRLYITAHWPIYNKCKQCLELWQNCVSVSGNLRKMVFDPYCFSLQLRTKFM